MIIQIANENTQINPEYVTLQYQKNIMNQHNQQPKANNARQYGLDEHIINSVQYESNYGEVLIANDQSKGGLMLIPESRGKKINNVSGGSKKVFIFEEQNQLENVVTALHPENQDFLEYKQQQVLPIHEIVMSLEGTKINEIKCGKMHNVILTDEGLLYSYGKGNFGSLGLGGRVFAALPEPILKLDAKKIVSVSCGMYHTLALSDIGDVFSWGRGFEGQLGLLQSVETVSSPHFIPHFFKYNKNKDVKTLQKNPIRYVSCGAYHSIAVDEEYKIYTWGEAMYGQTGNGKKSKQPVPKQIQIKVKQQKRKVLKAVGGFGHTLCLTSEGQIFSWGLNIKGQLGINDMPQNIKTTEGHLSYVKATYCPGQLTESRDKTILPKFKEIGCGFTNSFALDQEGNAWAWGGGNLGFKDKKLERGPVKLTEGVQNKKFNKLFGNQNSLVLFCSLTPLFFKPTLAPSSGNIELTFFGNGFVNTGCQSIRFHFDQQIVQQDVNYDQKTSTFFCKAPAFQKINKRLTYPLLCKIDVSVDKKQYYQFEKHLLIYSSKMQIQSIQPNCGSALGFSPVKIYMPIDELTRSYIDSISVGFKNNKDVQSKKQLQKNDTVSDWLCSQGIYNNQIITCKIPNIPQFDTENPFYMLDVSINGQQFTGMPFTFRYYFITETLIEPAECQDEDEPDIKISAKGLFDNPHKEIQINLNFKHEEKEYSCQRRVEVKWDKTDKIFTFKMPKLQWIIGDYEITPELLDSARKQKTHLKLFIAKNQTIDIGQFTFAMPPPPEPEQDKKDSKKQAKKAGKK